ncbi:hypothetical protein [Microbispora sitophila]|uniref:hypothetical protein n=1 Tax=Microbispora sitophila TaxID=2771537 RepID=UPI001D0297C3|nr:hypothetical protein [Microbispora sitophila]
MASASAREELPVLGCVLIEVERQDGPLTLSADEQHLTVVSRGQAVSTLAAICTGPPVRIAFDPGVLLPALDAGVGQDALLEISSPAQPVVVRSADQGTFTTLVMPVHGEPADE